MTPSVNRGEMAWWLATKVEGPWVTAEREEVREQPQVHIKKVNEVLSCVVALRWRDTGVGSTVYWPVEFTINKESIATVYGSATSTRTDPRIPASTDDPPTALLDLVRRRNSEPRNTVTGLGEVLRFQLKFIDDTVAGLVTTVERVEMAVRKPNSKESCTRSEVFEALWTLLKFRKLYAAFARVVDVVADERIGLFDGPQIQQELAPRRERIARAEGRVNQLVDELSVLEARLMFRQSDKTNATLSRLTWLSTALLPATLVAAWFGMNMKLPICPDLKCDATNAQFVDAFIWSIAATVVVLIPFVFMTHWEKWTRNPDRD